MNPTFRLLGLAVFLAAGCSRAATEKGAEPSDAGGAPLTASTNDARAVAADAGPAVPAALNVVVISIDSLRADMPWAGYPRPIAPNLTALAAKSVQFTRAYSLSSFTSKSLAAFTAGRYPSELARTGGFFTKYLASNTMFCESLSPLGVPCFAGQAHAYLEAAAKGGLSGFDQGYLEWRLVPDIAFDYNKDPYVTSQKLTPLAIELLGDAQAGAAVAGKTKPFFAWFHYMDPHDEYQGHDESPHFGKKPRDLYDEEVFYTDLWIGKLLDWIAAQPFAARTAIIITADHGEAFGEHGMFRHAHELWEPLVRVPFFVFAPGVTRRVIDEPRGAIDLLPTIADLLGVPPPKELRGVSLLPEIQGAPSVPRDVVCDLPEDEYNKRRRALLHGTTKLIARGNDASFSLFDLSSDPGERDDLLTKHKELAAEMRGRYREISKAIPEIAPTGGIPEH